MRWRHLQNILCTISPIISLFQHPLDSPPLPLLYPLIAIYATHCRDENLRRGCASIFCNLSFKEGSEESLVSAGIVPSLLVTAMITSDQMQAKVICVKVGAELRSHKWPYYSSISLPFFFFAFCAFTSQRNRDLRVLNAQPTSSM